MFIQTQPTPNPKTMKFLPGRDLLEKGSLTLETAEDAAEKSPLAAKIFELDMVDGVYLSKEFLSVTAKEAGNWDELRAEVLDVLAEHLEDGLPVVADGVETTDTGTSGDSDEALIRNLIEQRIRPALMQDGGDIHFHAFKDGVVYLEMQGACSGCPHAAMTLKNGVERVLKHYVPSVQEVCEVEG